MTILPYISRTLKIEKKSHLLIQNGSGTLMFPGSFLSLKTLLTESEVYMGKYQTEVCTVRKKKAELLMLIIAFISPQKNTKKIPMADNNFIN